MFPMFLQKFSLAASLMSGVNGPAVQMNSVPQVGDFAVLVGSITDNDVTRGLSFTTKNLEYDASTGKMRVQTSVKVDGELPDVSDEWVVASEMLTKDIAPSFAALMCDNDELQGELVELDTPVGVFQACKIRMDEDIATGHVWAGGVPFGVLKADVRYRDNSLRYQATISDYAWR